MKVVLILIFVLIVMNVAKKDGMGFVEFIQENMPSENQIEKEVERIYRGRRR